MRPNGKFSNDVARVMSLARLSSDTRGSDNDVVAVNDVDAGAGGNTVAGAWLTDFFDGLLFWHGDVWHVAAMSQGTA